MNSWEELIINLERALGTAKNLKGTYAPKTINDQPDIIHLSPDMTTRQMLKEIAMASGGMLVTREAIKTISANFQGEDRDTIRQNIYSTLGYWKSEFGKIERGIYKLK